MGFHCFSVFIVLLFCNSCDSYWNIQLSEQPITSVPFGSAEIAVWKNGNNQRKYFAMPLAQLMNQSAEIVQNPLTNRIQIEFKIIMWSEEAEEAVLSYLRQHANKNIDVAGVKPLPMSKVRLLWKDRLNPLDSAYRVVDQWQSNTALSSVLTFRIVCRELDSCTTLQTAINTSPETLYALDLDYVINGEQSERRLVTVSGNHALGGELYTRLLNMSTTFRLRYLTSEDVFALAKQTVANAVSSIKSESNYVDNGDEAALAALLHKHWLSRPVPATSLRADEWNAVYWSPAAARPDKIVQYLSRVLSDNPDSGQEFLLDINWKTISEGLDELLNVRAIFNTTSMNDPSASNSKTPINKDLVLSRLRDNQAGKTVMWTGTAFRVKDIPFYRLNLDSFSGSRKIVRGPVEFDEYRSVGSVRVRPQEVAPKTALELARQLRDDVNNTAEALRRRIQSMADNWPEYCHIPHHYCDNDTYYGEVREKTLGECKLLCEESSQCQSFLHVPTTRSNNYCRLRTFVCSSADMRPYADHNYYIKVWRVVPSIISRLMKSQNLDGTLSKVPTNPCERIGYQNYFMAWADQSQG